MKTATSLSNSLKLFLIFLEDVSHAVNRFLILVKIESSKFKLRSVLNELGSVYSYNSFFKETALSGLLEDKD